MRLHQPPHEVLWLLAPTLRAHELGAIINQIVTTRVSHYVSHPLVLATRWVVFGKPGVAAHFIQ
jgi:hypothetical protein